jgi:hypothetical protein
MSTADVVRLATEVGTDTRGVYAATEPDVIPQAASPSWFGVHTLAAGRRRS